MCKRKVLKYKQGFITKLVMQNYLRNTNKMRYIQLAKVIHKVLLKHYCLPIIMMISKYRRLARLIVILLKKKLRTYVDDIIFINRDMSPIEYLLSVIKRIALRQGFSRLKSYPHEEITKRTNNRPLVLLRLVRHFVYARIKEIIKNLSDNKYIRKKRGVNELLRSLYKLYMKLMLKIYRREVYCISQVGKLIKIKEKDKLRNAFLLIKRNTERKKKQLKVLKRLFRPSSSLKAKQKYSS